MRNITRGTDQIAGILRFFFTPSENLPDFLFTEGASIEGDLVLREGTLFYLFEASRFTSSLDQQGDDDIHGQFYAHNFSGFCTGDAPELASSLMQMKGRHFALLYQDHDDHLKLVGNKEHYLVFDYKFSPGTKPGEQKGYSFSFKGKSLYPSLFYSGQFEVSELGLMKPLPDETGLPSGIYLVDTDGSYLMDLQSFLTVTQ